MPYTALTDKKSDQYKLQQGACTDEDGFRRIGDDYMVAMGSYYTTQCGDRFSITLEDETQFTVTIGDAKADYDTDESGQYHPIYIDGELALANVIEFIIDPEVMDEEVLNTGTICSLGFEGNIAAIEKIITNEKRLSIEEN